MNGTILSKNEKLNLLKEALGESHLSTGRNFPVFSDLIDVLGKFNDTVTILELLPTAGAYLAGPVLSGITTQASFVGVLLFPVQQVINLINANETGQRMYSYRAASYTATAWAFGHPTPHQSSKIISNISGGPYTNTSFNSKQKYKSVWDEASKITLNSLTKSCMERKIEPNDLKKLFKEVGERRPEILCRKMLKSFERKLGVTSVNVWQSNYRVAYPN